MGAPLPTVDLLEREDAFAQLTELARSAGDGAGTVAAIVGAPGEGKSALLDWTAELGRQAGMAVWRAHGSTLERSISFGVIRQLLSRPVEAASVAEQAELFTGAARLAADVLGLGSGQTDLDEAAAQHGLYWLLVRLTSGHPAMLLIDDAHWADDPSLKWLTSLARRVDELPVLVVVASRPALLEDSPNPLAVMLAEPGTAALAVGPLSLAAVETLVRRELDLDPEEGFSVACLNATGGNPLAVIELLRELRRAGARADQATARRLGDRVPEAIARHVDARLKRLDPAAVELARALAVLGDRTGLRHLCLLSEVGPDRAVALLEELTAAGITSGTPDLRFEHPLIAAAVRDGMSIRRRQRLHAQAAELLAAEASDPEAVAAHLLQADPSGSGQRVRRLRAAADAALRRGATRSAVTYLQRALEEPPPASMRGQVLVELGHAAWRALDVRAIERVEAARKLTEDPRERARLDLMLAEMSFYGGDRDRLFAAIERGLREVEGVDPELSGALQRLRITSLVSLDAGWPPEDDERYARVFEPTGGPGQLVRLSLALAGLWTGRWTVTQTATTVLAVLDEERIEAAEPAEGSAIGPGLFALAHAGQPARAGELAARMERVAAQRGRLGMVGLASHARGAAELRQGKLAEAEASLSATVELADELGARFGAAITRPWLAETLIARGRLDDAAEVLARAPSHEQWLAPAFFLGVARTHLHQARGERLPAIHELERLSQLAPRIGAHNPDILPWRRELALLIAREEPARAQALVHDELADARRIGLSGAVGAGLRAQATLLKSDQREAVLREAVSVLEAGPDPLGLAGALIDLGAHLRRCGQRRAAREPLRRALDLVARSAAQPLLERATHELRAADGRPRTPFLSGAAALTPAELRTARLAASGLSNQEVAETLFVTVKTVEMQLTSAYRKLGCRSRAELPRALGLESERVAS